MTDVWVYISLFSVALLAATIFPLQSEALLVTLLLMGKQPVIALFFVASIGNILGSSINWKLGQSIEKLRHRRWFPIKEAALNRAEVWYRHYGKWSLLLSWVPIIGDPLTMIAGILREPFWSFLGIVSLAKMARYAIIILITLNSL